MYDNIQIKWLVKKSIMNDWGGSSRNNWKVFFSRGGLLEIIFPRKPIDWGFSNIFSLSMSEWGFSNIFSLSMPANFLFYKKRPFEIFLFLENGLWVLFFCRHESSNFVFSISSGLLSLTVIPLKLRWKYLHLKTP